MEEVRSNGTFGHRLWVMVNQLHIVVVNKADKKAVMIDVVVPNNCTVSKKEHTKLEKYQSPREQLEGTW